MIVREILSDCASRKKIDLLKEREERGREKKKKKKEKENYTMNLVGGGEPMEFM